MKALDHDRHWHFEMKRSTELFHTDRGHVHCDVEGAGSERRFDAKIQGATSDFGVQLEAAARHVRRGVIQGKAGERELRIEREFPKRDARFARGQLGAHCANRRNARDLDFLPRQRARFLPRHIQVKAADGERLLHFQIHPRDAHLLDGTQRMGKEILQCLGERRRWFGRFFRSCLWHGCDCIQRSDLHAAKNARPVPAQRLPEIVAQREPVQFHALHRRGTGAVGVKRNVAQFQAAPQISADAKVEIHVLLFRRADRNPSPAEMNQRPVQHEERERAPQKPASDPPHPPTMLR